MKAILELEEDQIRRLREALVRSTDNEVAEGTVGALLRILEWRGPKKGSATYYLRSAATGGYFELEQEEKIRFEIASWVNALEQALRPGGDSSTLAWLSPNLCEICRSRPNDYRFVLARTLRMAMLLQALLLGPKCPHGNPYRNVWELKESVARKLSALVERVKRGTARLGRGGNLEGWRVSLPLLLVVAVAESQCECAQPFVWEAHCAGRAHEELKRQWGAIDERVLKTVALLIRCQSVVGQRMRKTGGGRLLRLVEQGAKELCFKRSLIYDTLTLLAIAEEARNHRIPGDALTDDDYRNADAGTWGRPYAFQDQVALYLEFDPKTHKNDEPTWQFFGPRFLGLPEGARPNPDVAAFKQTVKEEAQAHRLKPRLTWQDFEVVSLGRHQASAPLNRLVGDLIRGWHGLAKNARHQHFSRYFDLRVLAVPNPFISAQKAAAAQKEQTLQVVLKDYLAAERLLFPNGRQTSPSKETAPPDPVAKRGHTAGDLFVHLLDLATEEMSLRDDAQLAGAEGIPAPLYAPFPLIQRITAVIHRLMPDQCFTIPLSIDNLRTEWIYIPYGIKTTDEVSKRILANFLLATLLNRAMAAGIRYAEIDLQNLSTPRGSQPDWMDPAGWQGLVEEEYNKGGYESLLGRYLRDFNTQRENVVFRARLARDVRQAPDKPRALAVGAVQDDLRLYLKANAKPDCWLLGVDIGGTLTKCQLFRFDRASRSFEPRGSVFHMSTRLPVEKKAELDKEPDTTERARKATADFAKRLVDLVRKRLTAHLDAIQRSQLLIGVTWPGPVRENHIAGTSGILEQFGLTRDMKKNKIDDIWEVDVAKAVARAWVPEFRSAAPFVCLLNDGDAEAVGTVVGMDAAGAPARGYPDRHVVSVVKLGTGLAGAVLDSDHGRLLLRPGLFEWGKIVLDLGGPRRSGFPQGVAADFLSKRGLSQLASRRGGARFQKRDEPDSAEIGLILETAKSVEPEEPYKSLLLECGALQAERRPPFGSPVSAEVYRLVYKHPDAEPDLIFEVRLAMSSFGDVVGVLHDRLDNLGRARLERLIGHLPTAKDVATEALAVFHHAGFVRAAGIAEGCVQTLGRYLADFCITLYDELGVREFRLTGGVLSGETGRTAKKAARERVGKYGLTMTAMTPTGDDDTFMIWKPGKDPTPDSVGSQGRSAPEQERGALGAACFAAAAFLQEQKQEGLQRLRLEMLRLPSGAQVKVDEADVFAMGKRIEPALGTYALSSEELLRFLQTRGPEWRFYQTQAANVFVKW